MPTQLSPPPARPSFVTGGHRPNLILRLVTAGKGDRQLRALADCSTANPCPANRLYLKPLHGVETWPSIS